MNPRVAAKLGLYLSSPQGRRTILRPGLFARTGSMALAVGLFRPRILIDPDLVGEHRVLQEFVRAHEGAHIVLGHTRLLAMAKWNGILLFAGLGAILGAFTGSAWGCGVMAFVGAWCEAEHGFTTLWLRAICEREADEVALGVMKPHAFASALKTLDQHKGAARGWRGYEDRVLNGVDWVGRLERVGVMVPEETARGGQDGARPGDHGAEGRGGGQAVRARHRAGAEVGAADERDGDARA